MKYKLQTVERVYQDLEGIKKYISEYSKEAAAKFVKSYKAGILRVRKFPYGCERYEDTEFRRMIVGNYLVFYVVNEDTRTVEVRRVLHQSRNIPKHLEQ